MDDITFTLFWLNGKSDVIKGTGIINAMSQAGYGAGAIEALDFYAEGNMTNKYSWSSSKKTWVMNSEIIK